MQSLDFLIRPGPEAPPADGLPPEELGEAEGRPPYDEAAWWERQWATRAAPGARLLDLGCGEVIERERAERLGYRYVPVDYESVHAAALVDAHALPFADASFDAVTAIALLEHIRYPFVMMREVHRVLKPGGRLLGTVSFLEPFHQVSWYHHSHVGTWNVLRHAGFEDIDVAPSVQWTTLTAAATMGLFPGMPDAAARALVAPLEAGKRLWWRLRGVRRDPRRHARQLRATTGAFSFAARKR